MKITGKKDPRNHGNSAVENINFSNLLKVSRINSHMFHGPSTFGNQIDHARASSENMRTIPSVTAAQRTKNNFYCQYLMRTDCS